MTIDETLRRGAGVRRLARLLALTYGLTIANLYYCQPLLPRMAESYPMSSAVVHLTTAGQLGYVMGLVLVVPLGDIVRRRRLVCVLLLVEAAALAATAMAPTVTVLLVAGAVIGMASASVVNVLVAYTAAVAADHERGRVIATVVGGGLMGVLLSRTVAGLGAEVVGWRGVFWAAAAVTLLLSAALLGILAPSPPETSIGYTRQLRATARLLRTEPVLRRRSLIGGCVFASFGVFWATVAFLLAGPPYGYGEGQIGLFALVGVIGTLAARVAGRAADRGRQHAATGLLLALGVAAFVALSAGTDELAWIVAGLVAMDVAISGTHMLNLSVVHGLVDTARSRVAAAYMTCYTLGGVLGSATGNAVYRVGGWTAVCVLGAAFMAAGLTAWAFDHRIRGILWSRGGGGR
ncbi:MFS transporter [Actinomadura rudentiformis]|uniref:MFS transporter n=1 Tax=Actinomadura rudentiformis TaxID=359158 RepID=UPI00178C4A5A|nr:MFS transporter [Actinomadura rudentiformis]